MDPTENDDLEQITHRLSQSQRIITAGTEDESSDLTADQFATYVPDPLVGKKLDGGRYHILSVLGRGGMSVVYKARQELVDRPVAIKTLTCQLLGDPVVLKRFQREIRALSKLSHPNIVSAFDCVVDSSGQPYFIMDFLDGESLAEVIDDVGPLAPDRVRRIFLQVCQAVSHAHNLQVLHRDLKPANIMLLHIGTPDEQVKVVDFGLAKLSEDAQKLTVTGEVWGSPSYMSPEQVYGKSNDARSDIYSVGCVMFEALSGHPPFRGASPIDTVMMQVNAAPPTFADVDPKLNIHPSLEAIVLTCLQKNPDERFQTMQEMAIALQELDLKSPAPIRAPAIRPQSNLPVLPELPPSPVAPARSGPTASPRQAAPPSDSSEATQPARPQGPSIIGRAPAPDSAQPASANAGGAMSKSAGGGGARADGSGAHAPQVVRPSSAMRSGASQNNQRMLVTIIVVLAVVFGLSGLAATFYFLGRVGPATQVETSAPPQTHTVPKMDARVPAQTATGVSPQTEENHTKAPQQTGTAGTQQPATTQSSSATNTATSATTQASSPTNTATSATTQPSSPTNTATSATTQPSSPTNTATSSTTKSTKASDTKAGATAHHGDAKPLTAKSTQPRKPRHHQHATGDDAGSTYVPPPVNDTQRWNDFQKKY